MPIAFREMMRRHARDGRLDWIGIRPARRQAVSSIEHVNVTLDGLDGDHGRPGKRAVTLLQSEHIPIVAELAGLDKIAPETLRRNLVVSGVNLAAFRKSNLRIGGVILHITGPCPPCSRMEEYLGHGGYNAMRGHGGWYAEVIQPGSIALGDPVAGVYDLDAAPDG